MYEYWTLVLHGSIIYMTASLLVLHGSIIYMSARLWYYMDLSYIRVLAYWYYMDLSCALTAAHSVTTAPALSQRHHKAPAAPTALGII